MWYEHLLHLLHLSESPSTVMDLISETISGYTDIVADIRANIGDNIRIY